MTREYIFEFDGRRLEIDTETGRLYWNGDRLAIDTLHLTAWQKIGAVITVFSALTVALMTVVQYVWPPSGN